MGSRLASLSAVTVALLAAGTLVGCGGRPEETVRTYFEALVDGDGATACDQLSATLREDIERSPALTRSGRSCPDVMGFARGLNPEVGKEDVEDLELDVDETGERATVRLENPLARRPEAIELVREDGEWRIASLETRPRL